MREMHLAVLLGAAVFLSAGCRRPGARAPMRPPTYTCYRPIRPIEVDGSLDDIAWRQAPVTHNFLLPGGRTGPQQTIARVLWDDERLYVAFDVKDTDIWAEMTDRDAKLWEQDCVEVFIEPTGAVLPYFEFEINALNVVLDLRFARQVRGPFDEAAAWDCPGLVHGVRRRDDGWTAEIAIPFASLTGTRPPKPGDSWKINLTRIDRPERKDPLLLAWGPTSDFHDASRMGTVTFAGRPTVQPAPPGPWISSVKQSKPSIRSWSEDDRIVGTYYFYWYDVHTGEHISYPDGASTMQDHPADMTDYAYTSDQWHARENRDILDAGIDFLLPVYWGVPGYYDGWSFAGVEHLVSAQRNMLAGGVQPPRIGLFYDTSTLLHNPPHMQVDLTTEQGKEWFYCTIRDFFSLVPPDRWACVGGRPIVFLYSAAFAAGKYDQSVIDYTIRRFRRDFWGYEPLIVREVSWQVDTPMRYAWGGALSPKFFDVTSVGPGYDHTAVRGRQPLVVDREDGRLYERAWIQALKAGSNVVMVETWNELHEGTDVCETKEYGRRYIDLTRKYAGLFKRREVVPLPDHLMAPHALDTEVSMTVGDETSVIDQRGGGDGLFEIVTVGGRKCSRALPNEHGPARYLYFDLPDGFMARAPSDRVEVEVTYYDEGEGAWAIAYDSTDLESSVRAGAFRHGGTAERTDTKQWKKAAFVLKECQFADRCNGADFRLDIPTGTLCVSRLVVRKLE